MLRVPAGVIKATLHTLSGCGQGCCECVVYWTGPVTLPGVVDGWDHPTHRRSRWGYQIDDVWLTQYWFRLGREARAVRAQVHTHPGPAFHSATDDRWPIVSQPGFLSVVIPDLARGPIRWDAIWAGYLTGDGGWRSAPVLSLLEVVP